MIITIIAYIFGLICGIVLTAVILTDWRNIGKPVDYKNMGRSWADCNTYFQDIYQHHKPSGGGDYDFTDK